MKTLLLAILASILLPSFAGAAQLEVGVGLARAVDHGDGVWYDASFPHSLSLHAPTLEVGLRGDVTPGLAWHFDAVDLGHYGSSALVVPDAQYAPGTQTGCNGPCQPFMHYSGSGGIWGVQGLLEAHTQGAWQFGVEAGPFVYHESWTLDVPDWYGANPAQITPVAFSQSQWAVGAVVGLSIRHHGLGLSMRYYSDGHGFAEHGTDPWPPIWKGQFVLMGTDQF